MKFYRVCHRTDKKEYDTFYDGPYTSDLCPEGMAWEHIDDEHPNIREEFTDYADYGCGFTSLEQYERWFSEEWREKLADRDFVLRVFDLNPGDIRIGRFQSIARLSAIGVAAEAEILPLTSILVDA